MYNLNSKKCIYIPNAGNRQLSRSKLDYKKQVWKRLWQEMIGINTSTFKYRKERFSG